MGALSDALRDLDFQSFIWDLEAGGWFEYVFPFMLVYAIIYTILNYVEIFEDKKPVKVIIALVVSLFAVAFPIAESGESLGDLMMQLFPGVTAFSMGILALYIVVGMLGVDLSKFFGNDEDNNNILKYILGGLGLLVVVYYYAKGFGWAGYEGSELQNYIEDPALYILVLFGVFFFWINKDDENEPKRKKSNKSETIVHKEG